MQVWVDNLNSISDTFHVTSIHIRPNSPLVSFYTLFSRVFLIILSEYTNMVTLHGYSTCLPITPHSQSNDDITGCYCLRKQASNNPLSCGYLDTSRNHILFYRHFECRKTPCVGCFSQLSGDISASLFHLKVPPPLLLLWVQEKYHWAW